MTIFAYYTIGPTLFPRKAMKQLLGEPHPLPTAAWAVGLAGALYALTSLVLALTGAVPLLSTVLPIRPENYYFWQTFFAVPFAVLAWAAASGLIHGLGRQGQVRGPFKRNASRAGAAVAAALFMAWLPMALAALLLVFGMDQEEIVGLLSLPGPWQVFDLALYVLAAGAAVVLLTLAAGQGEFTKAGRVRAALVGTLTTAVLASLFAIFIR